MKNQHVRAVQTAAKRTLIFTVIGVMWFLSTAYIFIWLLPQFDAYRQWMTNYYGSVSTANEVSVWMVWLWIPELAIFVGGMFWASQIHGMVRKHL